MNVDNVKQFVHMPDGSLRFKYIVEGANLFFTQVCGVFVCAWYCPIPFPWDVCVFGHVVGVTLLHVCDAQ